MRWPYVLAPLLTGCRPPEAPTELSELGAYLYRNFEEPDPAWLQVGMQNLLLIFSDADLSVDYEERAFTLTPLTEADLEGIDRPDADPGEAQGIGLAGASAYPPTDHASLVILTDQTPISPSSPALYTRSFLEPEDPSCFPERQCDPLRTWNTFIKENALMSIPCEMHKDYRWVELADSPGQWGVLGRSWFPWEAVGEQGQNTIHQSYSIDAFVPDGGGTLHLQVIWSQTSVPGLGDDAIAGLVKYGMHQAFEASEAYLGGD